MLIRHHLAGWTAAALAVAFGLAATKAHAGTVQRFVLAAGANNGGPDRAQLRYAISDARQFVAVMESMGGVESERRFLLEEPTVGQFIDAIRQVKETALANRRVGDRTELILYYSGHADESGLLLAGDRVSYQSLRDQLDAVKADVHISVLDACASGAITRIKGGSRQKAFLVDESSQMRGHAFLTSSSEDETAQESDIIGGSYFTHHLVSGLRGAADVTGDGKVTLGEAYQHAFHETLAQTTDSRGGAQHPSYDINLAGTGDVVMTDLRETSAGLILGEDFDGRFYIRNAQKQLVVELKKPYGRIVTIGLEPGRYDIHYEQIGDLGLAEIDLHQDERFAIAYKDFEAVDRKAVAALRGKIRRARTPAKIPLERRHRVQVHFGYIGSGPTTPATIGSVRTENISGGVLYGWWAKERVMVSIRVNGIVSDVSTDVSSVASILLGTRYFFPEASLKSSLRPYIAAATGPYIASVVGGIGSVSTEAAPGGWVGLGLDVPVSRWFMVGVEGGYNVMKDFSRAISGKRNYSGFNVMLGFSWTFGKGVET